MPTDDQTPAAPARKNVVPSSPRVSASWFEIPPPVKRVFDKYPLVTYAANELPLRAPRSRDQHVLHIFTTEENAKEGKPSFNPACLKWQVGFTPIARV